MAPKVLDIVMIPNMPAATLTRSGTGRLGTTATLTYQSPGDAAEQYFVLLALGNSPGLTVGAGRTIALNPDGLFFFTARPNSLLLNNIGTLSTNGTAAVQFPIPNISEFAGLKLYAGGITSNTDYLNYVKNFSPSVALTLQR